MKQFRWKCRFEMQCKRGKSSSTTISTNDYKTRKSLAQTAPKLYTTHSFSKAKSFDQTVMSSGSSSSLSVSSFCTNNGFIEFIDKNSDVNSVYKNNNNVTSKSRIPDILMINKYYGLIPQKFAITSRKPTCSTPNSACSSRRGSKSSSTKPRAKSSSYLNNGSGRKTLDESKGCRSVSDSPEPIKMVVIARNGQNDQENPHTDGVEQPMDPLIGPVTKKMSVEKYKKWKYGGGGRGRNLNLRTCSNIGKSLSLMDNRLPDGLDCHANRASEYLTNRRVIKIDLNKVSWDEGNYQLTTSSQSIVVPEGTHAHRKGSHENGVQLLPENNNDKAPTGENVVCPLSVTGAGTDIFVNNDNDYDTPSDKTKCVEKASCNKTLPENEGMQNPVAKRSTVFPTPSTTQNVPLKSRVQAISEHVKKACTADADSNSHDSSSSPTSLVLEETKNGNKNCVDDMKATNGKKIPLTQRYTKLSHTTLSFDENALDSQTVSSTELSKRRPATAAARPTSKTFSTPNSFNPPSKVIPWTQQKAQSGKTLTLAERRAKFQRTPSIHSSSSMSIETCEEDTSEIENNNFIKLSTNSSAFKETRKPLYVMQPPEVPTMISQINPNADEDIQIEIEKVAIMLKKMQTMKHFSLSLDSGIEAEAMKASETNGTKVVVKPGQSTASIQRSTDDEQTLIPDSITSLNASESESSSVSEDSFSEDQSTQKSKLVSTGPKCNRTPVSKNEKRMSRGDTTDGFKSKHSPIVPSVISHSTTVAPSSNKKSSMTNSSTPTNNSAPIRRPPLKKAVSISCEQELLKTGDRLRQNEVNSSVNDNGKSPRPKTAADSQHHRIHGSSGSRATHNYNHSQRLNNTISSSMESHASNCNSSSSGSQASRNRKILIKKALMEINQSSVNLRRKWGTLGRPRTAPTIEKNCASVSQSQPQRHPTSEIQQKRKPLKASPLPISGNSKMVLASSGKSSAPGGKSNGEAAEGVQMAKSNSACQTRAGSEAPEESDKARVQHEEEKSKGKSTFRQCFSLDESALLGFSLRSVNEGRIPIFEKLADMESNESCSATTLMDDEISFLSSKKREQCLKVYEKMIKTGCTIKLDTIFRGMLTPSEYRAFMRAAEKAAEQAEEEQRVKEDSEEDQSSDEEISKTNQIGGTDAVKALKSSS